MNDASDLQSLSQIRDCSWF